MLLQLYETSLAASAGFFENKEADAKARGQKLPKKKDPKEEFDNFLKSIEGKPTVVP